MTKKGVPPCTPPPEPEKADVVRRLTRIESKLVQLMKHSGMTTDGRAPLHEDDQPQLTDKENRK
jgi:hypothetical protein